MYRTCIDISCMAQTITKWIELLVPIRFLAWQDSKICFPNPWFWSWHLMPIRPAAMWGTTWLVTRPFATYRRQRVGLDQFLEDFRFERLGRNGIHGCMGHHGHYIPISLCVLLHPVSPHHLFIILNARPRHTPYHNLKRLVGNPGQVLKLFEHIFLWAIRCVGWMPIIPLDWNCSASESIAIISS